ncbi:hypothetical protein [Actinomadura pelletieri]|uniref:hypothetical protein n=1 Tax=Actinomadura pelletieri TaxID=111805 RepID=UPI0011C3D185|nr:hypothetical protein [Actinomadura pelletieri]
MVSLLTVREGPGLAYRKVGSGLQRGKRVSTDWGGIVRKDGYLWAPLRGGNWIADYKLGDGNGKWYVKYASCR